MRDRYDAEMWVAHHDQFSEWFEGVLIATGRGLRNRLPVLGGKAPQLLAAGVAASLTMLTFTAAGA